jgi:hypothetical protein
MISICTIEDCGRPHYGTGLCRMHYLRKYRTGTTDAKLRKRKQCTVEGCQEFVKGNGLCNAHYMRWYTGSNSTAPITPKAGRDPIRELPKQMSRSQWIIYAAGFFDGEGCISIVFHKKKHYSLELAVSQADPNPLWAMQSLFGGRIVKHGQSVNRPVYYWKASSRQSMEAIKEMLPFLVVKREQAIIALQFRETITTDHKVTPDIVFKREALRKELARIKRLAFSITG